MNSIQVISPGVHASIQDLGRFGYRHLGIPYAGVMDSYSAKLANALVNNENNTPLIELTLTGAKFLFNCDAIIALTGANLSPETNNKKTPLNTSINIKKAV